jgi:hypothetical protein
MDTDSLQISLGHPMPPASPSPSAPGVQPQITQMDTDPLHLTLSPPLSLFLSLASTPSLAPSLPVSTLRVILSGARRRARAVEGSPERVPIGSNGAGRP